MQFAPTVSRRLGRALIEAFTGICRAPRYPLIAAATLAAALGANTAFFAIASSVSLPDLGVFDSLTLISIAKQSRLARNIRSIPADEYAALIASAPSVCEGVAAVKTFRMALASKSHAEIVAAEAVSDNYFQVLGVGLAAGRRFDRGSADGSIAPIVISSRLATSIAGNPGRALGRVVRFGDRVFTVVGVAPSTFNGSWLPGLLRTDAWIQLSTSTFASSPTAAGSDRYRVFARLKPGATVTSASAMLSGLRTGAVSDGSERFVARPARNAVVPSQFDRDARLFGMAAVVISGLVLLITCANLANLAFARNASRLPDFAVRAALGAGRIDIIGLLLSESAITAAAAGIVALPVAVGVERLLFAFLPDLTGLGVAVDVSLGLRVIAYACGAVLVTAACVGLGPALRAASGDPSATLSKSGGTGGGTRRGRFTRNILVVAQVGSCVTLLLLAITAARGALVSVGAQDRLESATAAFATVNMDLQGFELDKGREAFRAISSALASNAGFSAMALTSGLPGYSEGEYHTVATGLPQLANGQNISDCFLLRISPALFSVVGLRTQKGRVFQSADSMGTAPVAIISEALAARMFPGEDPVGRQIVFRQSDRAAERKTGITQSALVARTVVGVVQNSSSRGVAALDQRLLYVPLDQDYVPVLSVVVRGRQGKSPVNELRVALARVDSSIVPLELSSLKDHERSDMWPRRLGASVLGGLALLGLIIAMVGVYSVVEYTVRTRQREIGIMRALGASTGKVYSVCAGDVAKMMALGVVAGCGATYPILSLASQLLYSITQADAFTWIVAPLLLVGVGLLGSVKPVWRAVAISPGAALRSL